MSISRRVGDWPTRMVIPEGSVTKRLILVVEDSAEVSEILEDALREEGFAVRTARNGTVALDLARTMNPDLITLDLGLPGTSGWDVVQALRAEPSTRSIPIVAVSAHGYDLEPDFAAQVTRVIPKPFYLSDVVAAVTEALDASR